MSDPLHTTSRKMVSFLSEEIPFYYMPSPLGPLGQEVQVYRHTYIVTVPIRYEPVLTGLPSHEHMCAVM